MTSLDALTRVTLCKSARANEKKNLERANRSGDARSKALTATGAYLSPLKAYPWYQTQCGVHVRRRGRRSPTEDPPPRADEVAVVLMKFHHWGDGANHSICLFNA